jgi:hypothetical protein
LTHPDFQANIKA